MPSLAFSTEGRASVNYRGPPVTTMSRDDAYKRGPFFTGDSITSRAGGGWAAGVAANLAGLTLRSPYLVARYSVCVTASLPGGERARVSVHHRHEQPVLAEVLAVVVATLALNQT